MEGNIQLVLSGYESRYSDLSVFIDKEESEFYIYLGVALLERVSINAEEIGHKMFIGRLYNSEVKLSIIQEKFNHDNRTIKKWGNALKTCDIDEMAKAFTGRTASKKTTPELIRYVLQQYKNRSVLGRSYREKIIMGVKDIFSVSLSPSLVSKIFRYEEDFSSDLSIENRDVPRHIEEEISTIPLTSVEQSPIFSTDYSSPLNGEIIHHAGLIIFELFLSIYPKFQRQILSQILLGAINIEQSKMLCFDSLSRFCSTPIKVLREQRHLLDEQASLENELELYRLNASLLSDGPNRGEVYYFDPHSKRYTGQLKILKGWCGSMHTVSKVINLDCFHTETGRPCFIQHYTPYYDMRERFFMSLSLFDELFLPEKRSGRTFVIDRGIFGLECFSRFEKDHLITWEKGFDGSGWDDSIPSIKFTRLKKKNGGASKGKEYSFECQEYPWSKVNRIRRIIVKATNPKGNVITVSVLCSNPEILLEDAVWLIFNRWLQENDFKYLNKHFGIDQLDSHAHYDFETIADDLNDRSAVSSEYKTQKKEVRKISNSLAKNLLKQNRKQKEIEGKGIIIQKLEAAKKLPENGLREEIEKELCKTENSVKRVNKALSKLALEQEDLEMQLEEEEKKQVEILKSESRIQQLIDENYQVIDTKRKAYIDALRINAANIFRNVNDDFRAIYNNYRDDHQHLRLLSRSNGIIVKNGPDLTIKLWLSGTIQNHIIRAMETLTKKVEYEINQTKKSSVKLKIKLLTGPISS